MSAILAALVLSAGAIEAATFEKGKAVYAAACALCHGGDGRGNPEWEGTVPPPDLSDCLANTAEPDEHWQTIVAKGGRARGLASVMPAFEEAYTAGEIQAVVSYLRSFCARHEAYPPGDLNFRRLLKTEKAFPEQELVLVPSFRSNREREAEIEAIYENRLGATWQYEVTAPVRLPVGEDGGGFGDVELGLKRVLGWSARGGIVAAGLGATLPTGREDQGNGQLNLAPSLAWGRGWKRTLVQARVEAEVRFRGEDRDTRVPFAVGLSRALGPPRVAWVPAVELAGEWNTATGRFDWSGFIEVSKPLTALGHLVAAAGVEVPLRPRDAGWRLQALRALGLRRRAFLARLVSRRAGSSMVMQNARLDRRGPRP